MRRLTTAGLALAAGLAGCDRHPVQPLEPAPAALAVRPATGHILDPGVLPGGTPSEAYAIADDGTVVGFSSMLVDGVVRDRAFRWTAGTGMVNLGASRENVFSYANAVNSRGQVARLRRHAGPEPYIPRPRTAVG